MAEDRNVQRGMVIRSFHRAFERDRRLHSIPSGNKPIVLPFEDGVAVRAFAYAGAVFALAFVLLRVPVVGDAMRLLPSVLWYTVFPVALGILGSRVERDGLVLHRWLELEARHRLTSRVRHGGRPVRASGRSVALPGRLPIGRDHHGPALRAARLSGPGRVEFIEPVAVIERRRGPSIVKAPARLGRRERRKALTAHAVDLDADDRIEIRA